MDAGEIKAVAAYIKMLETHEAVPSITDPADADNNLPLTFAQRLETLTPGERRVYEQYSDGCTAGQIAQQLGLSLNTVKTHSRRIYQKLGVRSRKDLLEMKGGDEG
jgi:DNA-binding CsgD family transcriptional regulator